MRDGIFIVDGDGHVMDFAHRCYQKYLPEQYCRRIAFFPGAQRDRRQAPNGDMGRDPNTPHEMMADLYPTSALRIGESAGSARTTSAMRRTIRTGTASGRTRSTSS